jgi:hypothetical protein
MPQRPSRIAVGSWPWAAPIALSVLAFAVVAGRSAASGLGLDYAHDAGPPIAALAQGDLGRFAHEQALMGSLSLLLRAPFAALAPGNVDAQYVLGVLPCFAIVLVVALAVRREAERRWGRTPHGGLVVVFSLLSAPALEALVYGHPEEPLGAALIVGAVLAALRRHGLLAGLLLGLALGTKQWAAFAVLPVLLACGGFRVRALSATAITGLALTAVQALANLDRFTGMQDQAVSGAPFGTPLSIWAPFSAVDATGGWGGFAIRLLQPDVAVQLGKPLLGAWTLGLVLLFAYRRGPREDAFALLALVFLGRCLFDPSNVYYHAPFLAALLAWEALRSPRPPWLTATSTAVLALIALSTRVGPHDPHLISAVYLAWALGTVATLGLLTVVPARPLRRLPFGRTGAAAAADL